MTASQVLTPHKSIRVEGATPAYPHTITYCECGWPLPKFRMVVPPCPSCDLRELKQRLHAEAAAARLRGYTLIRATTPDNAADDSELVINDGLGI